MFFFRKKQTQAPSFQGTKHMNLFAWDVYTPSDANGNGDYGAFYTLAQLQEIKAMGFDSVRFVTKSDPLIASQYAGNMSGYNALIAKIIAAGQLCVSAGLKVTFDMHLAGSCVINSSVLLASSNPSAPYFVAYLNAITGLAQAILAAGFATSQVALDLLNEPNPPAPYWASTLQPVAFTAVRAVAPNLTLIVGPEGGDYKNLGNINVSNYDWNTLYTVHFYEPFSFTYGSSTELGEPYSYFSQIDYPPDGISPATAIATATNNINADGSLSDGQKTAYIADATYQLTNYYSYLGRWSLLNVTLPKIAQWADRNGVDRNQLYIGEMGAWQSAVASSSSTASRAAYYGDLAGWFSARGIRWGIWASDIATFFGLAGFFLQDAATAGSGSVVNSSNTPAAIKTALGLV